MSDNEPIERAKADRLEVQRQITRLDTEIARMVQQKNSQTAELGRLTAFIDLYSKYANPPPPIEPVSEAPEPSATTTLETAPAAVPKLSASQKKPKRRTKGITHKPKTSPSMPNMIREALRDAHSRGIPALDSRGIQAFIASKWWSSVTVARIRPVAWRMGTEGELTKVSEGVYALPDSETEDPILKGMTPAEMRAAGIIPMHAKVVGEP